MYVKIKMGSVAALAAALTFAVTPAVAFADSSDSAPTAAQTATAITDASDASSSAPSAESVTDDQTAGDQATLQSANATIDTPGTAAGTVEVSPIGSDPAAGPATDTSDTADDSGTPLISSSSEIGIGIPGGASATASSQDVDGNPVTVYGDTSSDSSTAVEPLSDGVSMLTDIAGPGAPTTYSFPLDIPDGGAITSDGDGGYTITDSSGDTVATIPAPWAQDANGNPVPTYYTLDGDTLVQTVEFDASTAFPVVADPSLISISWGGFLGLVPYVWVNLSQTMQQTLYWGGLTSIAAIVCPAAAAATAEFAGLGGAACLGVLAGAAEYLSDKGICSSGKYLREGVLPWNLGGSTCVKS